MVNSIKLYGERNSATNYLRILIDLNIDVRQLRGVVPEYVALLQLLLPGREWLCDFYFSLTTERNLGWKHSCADPFLPPPESVGIVTMTKNPYAWLLSLHRSPHHHPASRKVDFETFLQKPWRCTGRDRCGEWLGNPIELWNLKNRSYLKAERFRALNLTAEALLSAPDQVIERIRDHFDLSLKRVSFINHDASTSDPGRSFEDHRRYYLAEAWREQLDDQSVSIINGALDPLLMDAFGYQWL